MLIRQGEMGRILKRMIGDTVSDLGEAVDNSEHAGSETGTPVQQNSSPTNIAVIHNKIHAKEAIDTGNPQAQSRRMETDENQFAVNRFPHWPSHLVSANILWNLKS
jgi:hypothetical protein